MRRMLPKQERSISKRYWPPNRTDLQRFLPILPSDMGVSSWSTQIRTGLSRPVKRWPRRHRPACRRLSTASRSNAACSLVLVRMMGVDILAFDLRELLFGFTEFVDTVECVELGNCRSPVALTRKSLSNGHGETEVRLVVIEDRTN